MRAAPLSLLLGAALLVGAVAFNNGGCASKACDPPTGDSPTGCSTAFINAEKVPYRVAAMCFSGTASCETANQLPPPPADMRYVPFAGGVEGVNLSGVYRVNGTIVIVNSGFCGVHGTALGSSPVLLEIPAGSEPVQTEECKPACPEQCSPSGPVS